MLKEKKKLRTTNEKITKVKRHKSRGITLIALVITIIVLLILAGVVIASLNGNNGILKNATTAKKETKVAEIKEIIQLMVQDYNIEKNLGKEEKMQEFFQEKASKGEISRIVDNKDGTYMVEKDGYEVIISEDGKIQAIEEKEDAQITEVWYKIDGTTLYFSNSDLGGYTKHPDTLNDPEWTRAEYSQITTKVVFQNRIVPSNTTCWFYGLENLTEIENINYLNTSKSTNMEFMFFGCEKLTKIDVSGFDTNNVTSMWAMFSLCRNLIEVDVSGFNTNKVTNMQQMFQACNSVQKLDLKSFNTANVTTMSAMFINCNSLTKIDVSNFDTRKVNSSRQMFDKITCPIYTGDNWTLTEADTAYQGEFLTKN